MAKIGEVRPVVVSDDRADSTIDRPGDTVSALGAIAAEEIAEDAALAAKIEAEAQAEVEAEMAALIAGWQEAMNHAADVVTSFSGDLKTIWTKDRMDNVGAALARCDAHYGWGGAAKLISHPLVGLGVAAAPVVIGTVKWAQVEKAKAIAQARAARQGSLAGAATTAEPSGGKQSAKADVATSMDTALAAA
jgi:hypothetical protein